MADRAVNVAVNVTPGRDELTPALAAQGAEAKKTAAALDDAKQKANALGSSQPAPAAVQQPSAPPPQPRATLSEPRRTEQLAVRSRGEFGHDEFADALRQAQEDQAREAQQARQRAMQNRARATLAGGVIPESAVSVVGPQGGAQSAAMGAGRAAAGLAQGLTQGENAAQGIVSAVGSIGGPLAIAAGVAGGLMAVAEGIAHHFRTIPPTLQEMAARMREAGSLANSIRASGTPTSEEFRNALGPSGAAQVAAAQRANDPERVRAVLQGQRQLGQQEMQQGPGERAGEAQAELQAAFEQTVEERRRPQGRSAANTREQEQRIERIMQRFNMRPQDMAGELGAHFDPIAGRMVMNFEGLNAQNAREMAAAGTTRRFEQGRARVEAAEAGLRDPNAVADLRRPGGLSLADMPQLFQSRQMDVLDSHSQFQAEMVRDEREEARFQTQVRLWTEIRDGILNRPAPADVPVPAVGD